MGVTAAVAAVVGTGYSETTEEVLGYAEGCKHRSKEPGYKSSRYC
mgnify:CR=1 FL=1